MDRIDFLERKPDPAKRDKAERQATNMTGVPTPKFKSSKERHETMSENYMGFSTNMLLALDNKISLLLSLLTTTEDKDE